MNRMNTKIEKFLQYTQEGNVLDIIRTSYDVSCYSYCTSQVCSKCTLYKECKANTPLLSSSELEVLREKNPEYFV
jgi:hypothetical protein